MIIHWQRVGFVHGVMNTDNMSILGLTIDYGPYGWLEGYDPNWTPNTTDAQGKRYRYGNQANMALWNLMQLANALYPLVGDVPALESVLKSFQKSYPKRYFDMMGEKLGFISQGESDVKLIQELEQVLQLTETDMTMFFRKLVEVNTFGSNEIEALDVIQEAFYKQEEVIDDIKSSWLNWMKKYMERCTEMDATPEKRKKRMNAVNPKYVLRNYMAHLAIDKADRGKCNLTSIRTEENLLLNDIDLSIHRRKCSAEVSFKR